MKLQDNNILHDVLEVYPTNIGKLFLYEELVVLEVFEGVHITYKKLHVIFSKIKSFYGKQKIGFVSNRINNYSIEAIDYPKFQSSLPNIAVFSVAYYNLQNAYNIEIEKKFLKKPFSSFTSLIEAYQFTKNYISAKKYISS